MKDNENKAFAKAIKKHLDAVAAADPHFAKAYANPAKSITSCCDDIIGWVSAKGASVVAAEEGEAMKHCVYRAAYYERPNSLILTVRVSGKRMETAEIDLRTGRVVQCFGINNSLSNYHTEILKFLAKNKKQLKRATI